MTLTEWRLRKIYESRAQCADQVEAHMSDRDAAISVAYVDCEKKVRAARNAHRDRVHAINLGEHDHEFPGDAA